MAANRKTSTQSNLDFDKPVERKFSMAAAGAEGLRLVPLMALLALLAQVGIRGLRPALAEKQDLLGKDVQLEELYSAAVEQKTQLELRLRAQDDPIYRERMRRLRVRAELATQLGEADSQ